MAQTLKKSMPVKEARINFRVSHEKQKLWKEVARKNKQTLTQFIEESVSAVADCELAEQKDFRLPLAQWKAFLQALDRPAQVHTELRKLLTEPSALELAHQAKK